MTRASSCRSRLSHGAGGQVVEHVHGREGVRVRAVRRQMRAPEVTSKRVELSVGHLSGQDLPCHRGRVDHPVGQARIGAALQSCVEKGDVEARVVSHEHRAARELEKEGEHRIDRGSARQELVPDAGEEPDERRNRPSWIHERLKGPRHLSALYLDRADLCDGAAPWGRSSRLEIHRAELDPRKGRAAVV